MSSSTDSPTLTTETTQLSPQPDTETAQPTKKITLKSSDNQIFEVEEAVAMEFATVKSFFEDSPSSTDTVPLPNVTAKPLSQVIEFCKEQIKFKANPDEAQKKKYHSEDLLDVLNQAVADRIENKSVEYVRGFFGIDNDFTAEEEAALRQEHAWAYEGVDED
ncbi:SKP1-like protein 14 [Populus alba x Populus x berolinensis]|uniref:SKP1-like protein n=1 Tax=Populus alba x Populus x berolinensis TaxID=444605 RepID=A0AAD6W2K6_9ROSI|nr:SKP1-like protein 14 [Populus alba x Populus x berolinensis]KAJ6996812.1 SKP1-like protein 14 [Populus alba x Populus x berolinensis]